MMFKDEDLWDNIHRNKEGQIWKDILRFARLWVDFTESKLAQGVEFDDAWVEAREEALHRVEVDGVCESIAVDVLRQCWELGALFEDTWSTSMFGRPGRFGRKTFKQDSYGGRQDAEN